MVTLFIKAAVTLGGSAGIVACFYSLVQATSNLRLGGN